MTTYKYGAMVCEFTEDGAFINYNGEYTSVLCADNEGIVETPDGEKELTKAQQDWVTKMANLAAE